MNRHFALILFGAFCHLAAAQEITTVFRLQSTEVGRNTYRADADGRFVSDTAVAFGATKVTSRMEGRISGEKLVEFTLKEVIGSQGATIVYAKGEVTITPLDKPAIPSFEIEWDEKYILATFHPSIMGRMVSGLQLGSASKVKVLETNRLRTIDLALTGKSQIATIKGEPQRYNQWRTTINGIDMELYAMPDGKFLGYEVRSQQFQVVQLGAEDFVRDPMAAFPELSQPTFRQSETITKALAPMRDGKLLATTVVLPKADQKFPVILARTPYGRAATAATAPFWVERGYVFVVQDTRGRGDSEGIFDPFNTEVQDGFDTLEWIKNQPWCDGNIGMIGASYGGFVQWSAAVTHHPNLKCIIPQVSPPEPVRNVPWDHGVFLLGGNVWWTRIVMNKDADMASVTSVLPTKKMGVLPLSKVDDAALGRTVPFYDNWLKRPTMAQWPGSFTLEQVGKVTIPTMHISGFWDGDGIGTKLHWEALRASGHRNQWLVFGPWSHAFNTTSKLGGVDYGASAILNLDPIYLRFFDTYLKARSVKQDQQPKVRMFMSGANHWLKTSDWPPPGSRRITWHLGGDQANSAKSRGELTTKFMAGTPHTYAYDPIKVGKEAKDTRVGDQASASLFVDIKDSRTGFLLFKTKPFSGRTALMGPAECELHITSTARDGNFHVMLVDQHPNGKMQLLGMPGNHRLTWTPKGFKKVKPGEVVKLIIKPWEFAHVFEPGHRLGVIVTSDAFPSFARNPGTGEPDASATRLVRATHSVLRSAKYPSRLSMHMMEW